MSSVIVTNQFNVHYYERYVNIADSLGWPIREYVALPITGPGQCRCAAYPVPSPKKVRPTNRTEPAAPKPGTKRPCSQVINENKVVANVKDINMLLVLGFDVYRQDPAASINVVKGTI
jgi:hypothetical protein